MKKRKNDGFTLVELIVVLVILAILAAILVPALLGYIDKSRQKQSIINCRQLVIASQSVLVEKSVTNHNYVLTIEKDGEDILDLAEVTDDDPNVVFADEFEVSERKLVHLYYFDKDRSCYVIYCAQPKSCRLGHKTEYTITDDISSSKEIIQYLEDDPVIQKYWKTQANGLFRGVSLDGTATKNADLAGTGNEVLKALQSKFGEKNVQSFRIYRIEGNQSIPNEYSIYYSPANLDGLTKGDRFAATKYNALTKTMEKGTMTWTTKTVGKTTIRILSDFQPN